MKKKAGWDTKRVRGNRKRDFSFGEVNRKGRKPKVKIVKSRWVEGRTSSKPKS